MIGRILKQLLVLLIALAFIGSLNVAVAKDKGQSGDRPPGWDQGKEKGWK